MSAALLAVQDNNAKLVKQREELNKELDTARGSSGILEKQQLAAQQELEALQKEIEKLDKETASLHQQFTDLTEGEVKKNADHAARMQQIEQSTEAVGQETVALQLEQVEGSRAQEHQLTELRAALAKVEADKAKSLQQVHDSHAKSLKALVNTAKELTDQAYESKLAHAEAQKLEAAEGEEIATQMEELDATLNKAEEKLKTELVETNKEYAELFAKYEEAQKEFLGKVSRDVEKTTTELTLFQLNLEAEQAIQPSEEELDRIQQQLERDGQKRVAAIKDARYARDTLRAELLKASATLSDLQFTGVVADAESRAAAARTVAKALGDSAAALNKASDMSRKRQDAAGKDEKKYQAALEDAEQRETEIKSLEDEIESLKKGIADAEAAQAAAEEAATAPAPATDADGDTAMATEAPPAEAAEEAETPKSKKPRGSKTSQKSAKSPKSPKS